MRILYQCSITTFVATACMDAANARNLRSPSFTMTRGLGQTHQPQTATTTECGNIHDTPYKGRLILNYEYQVDTYPNVLLDLPAVEDALVQAVVAYLDTCDDRDRPMYAVEQVNSHVLSTKDSCVPVDANHNCHVIDGSTNILLDSNVTSAKELAYDAIKAALADEEFISSFAPAVASARFIQNSGRDSFIITPPTLPEDELGGSSTTTTVVIAVASVAFVVMALFVYGMLRRHPSRFKGPLTSPIGKATSPGHIGIKPGSYYEGLDDEQPSLFHLDINSESPSNTWSVSDITSEGSIRSGLSRGTSTLEKIDEETLDEIEMFEDDEEDTDEDTKGPIRQRSPDSIRSFIANFDVVDRRNTSQNNGPHDAMESMDLSHEDYDEEATCTMLPVYMSTEEAQRMLDGFLTPFSSSPNAEDEAKDVPLAALCDANATMDASPIVKEAAESSEDEQVPPDKVESPVAKGDPESSNGDKQEKSLTDEDSKAEQTTVSEGKESGDDTDEEGSDSDPISSESTNDGALVGDRIRNEEASSKDLLGSEEELTTGEVNTEIDLGENMESKAELSVDGSCGDRADSKDASDCEPTRNDDCETARAERSKAQGKVEEVDKPLAPEQDISVSCDERAPREDGDSKVNDESELKEDDANNDENSTSADGAVAKVEASVVSPDSSTTNEKNGIAQSTDERPIVSISHAQDGQNPVETTTQQEYGSGEETGKEHKHTRTEDSSIIDRVASVEEPVGLAVRDDGDSSFDDSLAVSTYTAASDEEVSLAGWLTSFLSQMNRDDMCVSECQAPCQSKDETTEE